MKLLKLRIFNIIIFSIILNIIFLSGNIASLWAVNGPHADEKIRSPEGVCANCHIPHSGKGPKIWAQPLGDTFGGTRRLCFSCH